MLVNLANPGQIQADLFAPPPRPRSQELMATLDRINAGMGRGTVRLARVPAQGGWAIKQERRSPCYTRRWGSCRRCIDASNQPRALLSYRAAGSFNSSNSKPLKNNDKPYSVSRATHKEQGWAYIHPQVKHA
ncbi:DUF4113 domain-containing protein [Pseudomonas sp.]|uniref:DUF4113 domain-containing protein n=1 Tax=Pseudomonas sp. TaxID=306 RepID=UPI00299EA7DD|nr:DUF4113 domain-containing protein [Pseudomonas sp.]MDX1368108.1 DUF4113 domain-containing protein [Pseudomonas sp.]